VAVCLSGALDHFLEARVQRGLVGKLHRPGYTYFLAVDRPLSSEEQQQAEQGPLQLRPGQVYSYRGEMPFAIAAGGCPRGTANALAEYPHTVKLLACYHLIEEHEAARAAAFDYVLRTRTDALFLRPFPRADAALAQLGAGRQLLLFDDQLGLARREHAATLLLNPALAYRQCADAAQWTRACGRPVTRREPGAAPCGSARPRSALHLGMHLLPHR